MKKDMHNFKAMKPHSVKLFCVAPWRLPEHVELARVIEAESLE